MKSENLVSVIVTSYNQGKYLHESLGSLLNQSNGQWECLIINDGSTDETERIALGFCERDRRFSYFFQENQGVSFARNVGLSKVNGAFIQFLDADDKIHSRKIEYQLSILKSNPSIDLIYGSSRYFFDGSFERLYPLHLNGAIPCDLTCLDGFQVEMILKGNICTNCSLLFRRNIIQKVNFRKVIYEDWVFNLECALNGFKFHFDNSPNSYSYIRMTNSSQMVKHTNQLPKIKEFNALLFKLVKDSGYVVDEKIITLPENGHSSKIKTLIREITPPFIYELGAILKQKAFLFHLIIILSLFHGLHC